MNTHTNQNNNKDKLELLLERYENEQREFENHWLWQELGTTPKQFFAKVNEYVEKSGIDKKVWEQKLSEAKQTIETRIKEQRGQYKKVNFTNIKGLKV